MHCWVGGSGEKWEVVKNKLFISTAIWSKVPSPQNLPLSSVVPSVRALYQAKEIHLHFYTRLGFGALSVKECNMLVLDSYRCREPLILYTEQKDQCWKAVCPLDAFSFYLFRLLREMGSHGWSKSWKLGNLDSNPDGESDSSARCKTCMPCLYCLPANPVTDARKQVSLTCTLCMAKFSS